MTTINHWAVITAAASSLLLGGIWYSPILFYKAWVREAGMTEEALKKVNPLKTYGLTLLLSLIMAYNLAMFLDAPETDGLWGLQAGFLAGFGWAFLMSVVIGLFEQKSWKYLLINGGYMTLWFCLAGWIIGTWR